MNTNWLRCGRQWMALAATGFVTATFGATPAPAPTPAELLRQGVVAEETGGDPQRSLSLYREAVAVGESQRVATATALFRLGELEWRQGKTNDATRTWQLLSAQYPDQTNLLGLVRDRVPQALPTVATPSPVVSVATSAIERAAADVGQVDGMTDDQVITWLNLRGVATPGLAELGQRQTELGRKLAELGVDHGAEHPEVVKATRLFDLNRKQLRQEVEVIVLSLKTMAKGNGGAKPSSQAASPLEQAAAALEELEKMSPDQLVTWLRIHEIPAPELTELMKSGNQLSLELAELEQTPGANSGKVNALRSSIVRITQRTMREQQNLLEVLRMEAKRLRTTQGSSSTPPSNSAPKALDGAKLPDISPEEQAELARVQRLLKDSPDLLTAPPAKDQLPPLENAAFNGYQRVIDLLLTNRFDIKGSRALHVAVAGGRNATVQKLIDAGADVNRPDAMATPLFYAVAFGHRSVVQTLLKAGAEVNGWAWNPSRREILPSFGSQRVNEAQSRSGSGPDNYLGNFARPVHAAVFLKDLPLTELLLSAGADRNTTNANGSTLLHTAAKNNQLEIATLLLNKGADPNRLANGNSPLAVSTSLEMTRLLLDAKADPNLAGQALNLPLWNWINRQSVPELALALERGARVDVDWQNSGPLNRALASTIGYTRGGLEISSDQQRRAVQISRILLQARARYIPNGGERMLTATVRSDEPELVETALQLGEKPDDDVETPLAVAVQQRNSQIVELLLDAGADPNKRSNLRGPHQGVFSSYEVAKRIASWDEPGRAGPLPPALPGQANRRAGTSQSTGVTEIQKILGLLIAKGGRDFLSGSNSIAFATSLTNYPKPIFFATLASVPREYRLSDLLELLLTRPLEPGQEDKALLPWYPDLRRAEIYNDLDRTQPARRQPLDLQALIDSGEFGKSQRIEWGDILLIPEGARTGNEAPFVLSKAKADALQDQNRRTLTLKVDGESGKVELVDKFVVFEAEKFRRSDSQSEIQALLKVFEKRKFKFHGRFQIMRRGEPAPLDQVYPFDASLKFDSRRMIPVAGGLQTATPRNDYLGEYFRFQDGDEVTLYPLPAP